MDPEETLKLAALSIKELDPEEAKDRLDDYLSWRRIGGFQPKNGDQTFLRLKIKLIALKERLRTSEDFHP